MSSIYDKENAMYNDLLINYASNEPKRFRGKNNIAYNYYYNQLLHMLYSMFEFKNLPDNWDRDYMLYHLFTDGYVCVTDTKLGVLPLLTSVTGVNVYNKPTRCIISNPVLGTLDRKIGEDCILLNLGSIKEGSVYFNFRDTLNFFAVKLANIEASFNTNLSNSRLSMLFIGNNTAEIKSMKKAYDNYSKGDPAIFIQSNSTINKPDCFLNNIKNTYIADLLQDTKNDIYKEFLTYIGINSGNTDKKERMLVDEINANNQETSSHIYSWFYNLKKCIVEVNKMFDLDIKVRINYEQGDNANELDKSDETLQK